MILKSPEICLISNDHSLAILCQLWFCRSTKRQHSPSADESGDSKNFFSIDCCYFVNRFLHVVQMNGAHAKHYLLFCVFRKPRSLFTSFESQSQTC